MTRVYAVEDQWAAMLARGGTVDFFGSTLTVPLERRFADLESVRHYVEAVLDLSAVRTGFPNAVPLAVRARKGQTKAHYEPGDMNGKGAVIAIPMQARWAGRECVVLHEIAHHLACSQAHATRSDKDRWHGAHFRAAMCAVVACVLGDEAALLLRAGYEEAGLSTVVAVG